MAMFKINTLFERLETKINTYVELINILGLLQNNSKDYQRIVVIVFEKKIDTSLFITCLPKNMFKKVIGDMSKVLSQQTISFISI